MRDRYMTGTESGGIDLEWLLDCLEVGEITMRVGEEEDYGKVDSLYLSHKGLRAAEEYLLARYHLYSQVYMHKTTRGAEQMLGALLRAVVQRVAEDDTARTGLTDAHPLVAYYKSDGDLEAFLALDDALIWAALPQMTQADDKLISDLSSRLLTRRLYKCFDAGVRAEAAKSDSLTRFRKVLKDGTKEIGLEDGRTLLRDEVPISAYGEYSFDERGALQKVLIGSQGDNQADDVAERSKVVAAISDNRPVKLFRVYVPDRDAIGKLNELWKDAIK